MADQNDTDVHAENQPMSTADLAHAGDLKSQAPAEGLERPSHEGAEPTATLLPENESGELRRQWDAIQTGFVDEPRRAVEQADELVAGAMKRLAEVFAAERGQLESQWDRGDDVSTEDLRIALQRYRAFFGRLLSI